MIILIKLLVVVVASVIVFIACYNNSGLI